MTNGTTDKLDVLLTELEQTRNDVRQSVSYQGQVLTSGLAAAGLILGYSFVAGSQSDSANLHVLITAVPLIIGAVTILSLQEATNYLVYAQYLTEVETEIRDISSLDTIGYHSRYGPAFGTERTWLKAEWLTDWIALPLQLFYAVSGIAYVITVYVTMTTEFAVSGVWGTEWKLVVIATYALLTIAVGLSLLAHRNIQKTFVDNPRYDGETADTEQQSGTEEKRDTAEDD